MFVFLSVYCMFLSCLVMFVFLSTIYVSVFIICVARNLCVDGVKQMIMTKVFIVLCIFVLLYFCCTCRKGIVLFVCRVCIKSEDTSVVTKTKTGIVSKNENISLRAKRIINNTEMRTHNHQHKIKMDISDYYCQSGNE